MAELCFWIINSDGAISGRWEALLRREGWPVRRESDFPSFSSGLEPNRAGILLLDWDALRFPQAEQIRKFRERAPGVSVILTAPAAVPLQKVIEALEAGADDHIPHSVEDKLLLAKVKAHMRRMLPHFASALEVLRSPQGGIKLDRGSQQVWVREGRAWAPVSPLTPTEFQFLTLFLEQPGKALDRRFIVETVWRDPGIQILPGTVDKHVESLRRKLGRRGSLIRTVYGVGYALREG